MSHFDDFGCAPVTRALSGSILQPDFIKAGSNIYKRNHTWIRLSFFASHQTHDSHQMISCALFSDTSNLSFWCLHIHHFYYQSHNIFLQKLTWPSMSMNELIGLDTISVPFSFVNLSQATFTLFTATTTIHILLLIRGHVNLAKTQLDQKLIGCQRVRVMENMERCRWCWRAVRPCLHRPSDPLKIPKIF